MFFKRKQFVVGRVPYQHHFWEVINRRNGKLVATNYSETQARAMAYALNKGTLKVVS